MQGHRPTTRVLAVLELLQAHGRATGAELASRVGVDGRTLRRYIVMLEEMGIPIVTERGRHGGYALVAGFKLPPMIFTNDETLALSIGLLATRHLGLGQTAPATASAQAKLERVMPAALKRRVQAINDTVKLDLPRATTHTDSATLIALSTAAKLQQRVHLRYASAKQSVTEREFDPYGLAFQGGCWYVAGLCHLRHGLRSFRLDRIIGLHVLDVHFEQLSDFDAVRHLNYSMATLPRTHAIEVLLKSDLESVKKVLLEWMGVLEETDGGVLLRSQADDLDWFARQLAHLPFDFTVLQPRELRDALAACAHRLLKLAAA